MPTSEDASLSLTSKGGPARPENVGSRFLSLLQSAPDQTLSAISRTAKKPNCRRHSRVRLGGSRAERYGKSLPECRFVSGAWGLADLLYKLFWMLFQRLTFVSNQESRYPVRLAAPHDLIKRTG